MRSICIGAVIVAVLFISPNLFADDLDTQAKEAFADGKALFEKESYIEAAKAFREAYQLKPTWKLHFNIGQSEAAAKRYGLALEAFEAFMAGGGDEIEDDRRDDVINELNRLRSLCGSVELIAPDGATVIVDGEFRGETPLPGPFKISAGANHELLVSLNNEELLSRMVKVSGGDTSTIKVGKKMVSDDGQEEQSDIAEVGSNENRSNGSPLKITGWITLGVGTGVAIAGSIVGGSALSINKELVSDDCSEGMCLPQYHQKIDDRDKLATASTVLISTGAAVAGAGIVLLIVGHTKDKKENNEEITLIPSAWPGFVGATIRGEF